MDVKNSINIWKYQKDFPNPSDFPGANVKNGVSVKHDSYARYLGKLKGKNIITDESQNTPVSTNITNNKQFRFSIINTNNCSC